MCCLSLCENDGSKKMFSLPDEKVEKLEPFCVVGENVK